MSVRATLTVRRLSDIDQLVLNATELRPRVTLNVEGMRRRGMAAEGVLPVPRSNPPVKSVEAPVTIAKVATVAGPRRPTPPDDEPLV